MPNQRARTAWAIVVAITLLGIAVGTLTPASSYTHEFSVCLFCAARATADAIANVVAFAPVGMGLRFAGVGAWTAIAIAAGISAMIETLQMFVPGRDPGLTDMLTNTAGGAAGALVASHLSGRSWIAQPYLARGTLAMRAAALTVLAWTATGWLFGPSFRATDRYWGQWNPVLESMPPYEGQVLTASIGGEFVPPHELKIDGLAARMERGEMVRVRVAVGPPPPSTSDIFSIADADGRRVLMIGADGVDAILRYQTRSALWRLDQPHVRIEGAFSHVTAGSTVELLMWRDDDRVCFSVGDRTSCEGLGLADGASLILHPSALSGRGHVLWRVGWMAVLVAPVGFSLDYTRRALIALVLLCVAVVVVPMITPAAPARGTEWAGVGLGLTIGVTGQAGVRASVRFRR